MPSPRKQTYQQSYKKKNFLSIPRPTLRQGKTRARLPQPANERAPHSLSGWGSRRARTGPRWCAGGMRHDRPVPAPGAEAGGGWPGWGRRNGAKLGPRCQLHANIPPLDFFCRIRYLIASGIQPITAVPMALTGPPVAAGSNAHRNYHPPAIPEGRPSARGAVQPCTM